MCCARAWAMTSIVLVRSCGKWSPEGIWAGRPGKDSMTTSKNLGATRAVFGGAVASALESDLAPRSQRHGSAASAHDVFAQIQTMGHEQLLLSHDPSCGYLGIVALPATTPGPPPG